MESAGGREREKSSLREKEKVAMRLAMRKEKVQGMLALALLTAVMVLEGCPRYAVQREESRPGMVFFAASTFKMGKEGRQVQVGAFLLDRSEVRVGDYMACVRGGVCAVPAKKATTCNWGKAGREEHPMNCISWKQAQTYCRSLGKRLPTSKEWERAARGLEGRSYPWGASAPSCRLAVYQGKGSKAGCDKDGTWPVGSFPAGSSPEKVLDLAGNVAEWVADCASSPAMGKGERAGAGKVGGAGAGKGGRSASGSCSHRVLRGGSWQSEAAFLKAWVTSREEASLGSPLAGFRCAASVGPPPAPPKPVYQVSIPEMWVAPSDNQGRSWDEMGALPQKKLLSLRQRFDEKTKGLFNQYCWLDTNKRWTCAPAAKVAWPLFIPVLFGIYKLVYALAQKTKAYRPDPVVEIAVGSQVVVFPVRGDTYHPQWKVTRRLHLQPNDVIQVRIYDGDTLGMMQPLTQFKFTFQPPKEAQQSKKFKYIHNKDNLVKNVTLLFVPLSR
jgi:formylglycine-generating enzyme